MLYRECDIVVRLNEFKRNVLLSLKGSEEYGYNIAKGLSSRGNIHLGYLYETLIELETENLVQSRWEKGTKGPKRKVYSLTHKGELALQDVLAETIQIIDHFYGAYLSALPPEKNVATRILSAVNAYFPIKKAKVLIFVITDSLNPAWKRAIRQIQSQNDKVTIYLVKPSEVEVNLQLPNIVVLNGSPENVPLKNGLADGIILESFCSTDISSVAKEIRRIVNPTGVAVFLAYHLQLAQAHDPLDVGEFIEKMSSEWGGRKEIFDPLLVKKEISVYFTIENIERVGPLTAFITKAKE